MRSTRFLTSLRFINVKLHYQQILNLFLPLLLSVLITAPHKTLAANQDFKMVVTAAFVSEKGMFIYDELASYLAGKLSSKVDVISGVSYEDSNLLLKNGIIQIGFVCGLPYTHNLEAGNYRLVAIPVMALEKGDFPDIKGYQDIPQKYYSYTIVRKDSKISNWQQLKGKSFAYNDQNSNSGYNMPRYKLVQLGAKSWEDYFSRIVVSGSHEESIRLVANGIVDASSVDSLVLDYDRYIGDADANNVKIIEHLFPGGAGIPPVVISNKASEKLFERITHELTHMHLDKEGMKILKKALIKRFDPPDDANYDDIRRMEAAAHKAGFKDHLN